MFETLLEKKNVPSGPAVNATLPTKTLTPEDLKEVRNIVRDELTMQLNELVRYLKRELQPPGPGGPSISVCAICGRPDCPCPARTTRESYYRRGPMSASEAMMRFGADPHYAYR